jgi:hypothetical protein
VHGESRNRHAFARLGFAADLQRSSGQQLRLTQALLLAIGYQSHFMANRFSVIIVCAGVTQQAASLRSPQLLPLNSSVRRLK